MIKKYFYITFALLILVISWEAQKNDTVVAAPVIPQEAIRLRILANSDSAEDQWLKREIRDDVVAYMQSLTGEMDSIETARQLITKHLPEIERRSEQMIERHGFTYDVDVDFGRVPFPTKLYGNHVYPAGDYEAVRISIGEGTGANWWCVLFPPLCFVDMTNADAVDDVRKQQETSEDHKLTADASDEKAGAETDENEWEVRFFLVDWFLSLMKTIKNAFTALISHF